MDLGLRTWQAIYPPRNNTWVKGIRDSPVRIPYPLRFRTRESFENFLADLEAVAGGPAELTTPTAQVNGTAMPAWSDPLTTAESIFAFTSQKILHVIVKTDLGYIQINNADPAQTQISAAQGDPGSWPAAQAAAQLTAVVAKHATAYPRWRKWPRVAVLTDVPAHEVRNRRWQTSVGLWSVFLGGAAGVVGSWIVNGQ